MSDKHATVFVAEDNPILLQGLSRALTGSGYTVETAADGILLMNLMNAGEVKPDLLLLDVMMPGMGGLDVLREVREDGRWPGLPILLITAATDELTGPALESEEVEVLPKPFRLGELLARIDDHIRKYQASGAP
ncbi:MAG TPA: response regulator [Longimicrobiaceae bacterium]|nr:response regulator [Longimicrobiaceae bacterium]